MGLLAEPVDISKYEFARMPHKEQWGILTRRDSELALKKYIRPEDLADVPLLMVYEMCGNLTHCLIFFPDKNGTRFHHRHKRYKT